MVSRASYRCRSCGEPLRTVATRCPFCGVADPTGTLGLDEEADAAAAGTARRSGARPPEASPREAAPADRRREGARSHGRETGPPGRARDGGGRPPGRDEPGLDVVPEPVTRAARPERERPAPPPPPPGETDEGRREPRFSRTERPRETPSATDIRPGAPPPASARARSAPGAGTAAGKEEAPRRRGPDTGTAAGETPPPLGPGARDAPDARTDRQVARSRPDPRSAAPEAARRAPPPPAQPDVEDAEWTEEDVDPAEAAPEAWTDAREEAPPRPARERSPAARSTRRERGRRDGRAVVPLEDEGRRVAVRPRRRRGAARMLLAATAGLLAVAALAVGGWWVDRGGLARFGITVPGIDQPAALRRAGTRVVALEAGSTEWTTVLDRDLGEDELIVAADAPFRLRIDGTVFTIDGSRPLRLPLQGAGRVEARAIFEPVELRLTRLERAPAAAGG